MGEDAGIKFTIKCGSKFPFKRAIITIGLIALGIAKIAMGAYYLHDCSIHDLIPVWLIVSGCAPVLLAGFLKENSEKGDGYDFCRTMFGVIGFLFNIVWLACGSVWVYPTYRTVITDDFTPCMGNITVDCTLGDCNNSLLKFAFGMATLDWIFMGFWIVMIGWLISKACDL